MIIIIMVLPVPVKRGFTKARTAQFASLLLLGKRHKFIDEPAVHSLYKRTAARWGQEIVGDGVALGHGSARTPNRYETKADPRHHWGERL